MLNFAAIGKNIVYLRKQQKLSQEGLAFYADISVSRLRDIEHGRANVTIDTLECIAKALNVPLLILFLYEPISVSDTSETIQFRIPIPITEVRSFHDGNTFPVCPRCRITLEREFQSYCDRCGQALDWDSLSEAKVLQTP